jgi:hypothetical protein
MLLYFFLFPNHIRRIRSWFQLSVTIFCAEHRHKRISAAIWARALVFNSQFSIENKRAKITLFSKTPPYSFFYF